MKKLGILNFIETVILILLVIVPLRTFFFEPFFVMGSSMEPYYHSLDYLIIDKFTFKLRDPKRGEVIVFHPPFDSRVYYIKRIVGLPGELIEIKDGKIYVNGREFQEKYFSEPVYTPGDVRVLLGEDEYFVLGDNREHSFDSRKWGPLPKNRIVGRVMFHISVFNKLISVNQI